MPRGLCPQARMHPPDLSTVDATTRTSTRPYPIGSGSTPESLNSSPPRCSHATTIGLTLNPNVYFGLGVGKPWSDLAQTFLNPKP